MENQTIGMLFSMVDFASIFVFTMSMFFIEMKSKVNIVKLIVSVAILSAISHIIIQIGYQTYSLFVLIPLVFLVFKFIFKQEGIIYPIWISVTGYIFVLTLQMFLIFGSLHLSIIRPEDAEPYTNTAYVLQSSTFLIVAAISYGLIKFGNYMTFDFSNYFGQKTNFKSPVPYIVSAIVIFLFVSVAFPQFYGGAIGQSFYRSMFAGCVSLAILIILSLNRNTQESQRSFVFSN